MGAKVVMTPSAARWVPRHGGSPVDLWTSPTDRREPYGPCGQARGQRSRVAHRLAHTLAPLAHNPTGSTTDCSREQPDNPCATKPDSSICCQQSRVRSIASSNSRASACSSARVAQARSPSADTSPPRSIPACIGCATSTSLARTPRRAKCGLDLSPSGQFIVMHNMT